MAPISKKKHILSTFMCESSSNHANFSDSENSNTGSLYENHHYQTVPDGSRMMVNGSQVGGNHSESEDTRQFARVNRVILDKNSDEYRKRRERNNLAVKKSRTKSKLKTMETIEKVNILKSEKDFLQRKVDLLSRELRLLKDIFMAHASNAHGTTITEYDLKLLTGADLLDIPPSSVLVPPPLTVSPPPGSLSDYDIRSRTSSSASSQYGHSGLGHGSGNSSNSSHLQEALTSLSPSISPVNNYTPRSVINFRSNLHPSSISSRDSICHDSEDDY